MMHIFENLRVLGVLEVEQEANLKGSKASKVLKGLFSEQKPRDNKPAHLCIGLCSPSWAALMDRVA